MLALVFMVSLPSPSETWIHRVVSGVVHRTEVRSPGTGSHPSPAWIATLSSKVTVSPTLVMVRLLVVPAAAVNSTVPGSVTAADA